MFTHRYVRLSRMKTPVCHEDAVAMESCQLVESSTVDPVH